MVAGGKDFYRVLSVAEKASQEEIKKAYRKLAKIHHPDANLGNNKAAERFKDIGEAYSVLGDPGKRKQYDQIRRLGGLGFGGGQARGSSPGVPGMDPGFSFSDIEGGFGNISDLFSSLFDMEGRGAPTAAKKSGRQKGQNIDYIVEIPFLTAVRGGKISADVAITEDCITCDGDGAKPATEVRRCNECGGTGTVSFGQGGFAVNRPCPGCFGRGKIPQTLCESCLGRGAVRQTRKIQINVRPGINSGSKVRLSGQGERGKGGGPSGDLIITYKVAPHRFFTRKGLDIYVSVTINIVQATLGSKVRVRTVFGKKVALSIPKGTQSGTRFRLRGQGIEKEDRVGDQYVEVVVQVPEKLSDEEQEAMEEFREASGLKH